jgi:hypothetical protein
MMIITRNSRWGSPSPKYDNSDRGNAVKCTQEVDGGPYEGAVYVKDVDKRQLQVLQGKDQVVQDLKAVDYYRT